MGLLTGLRKVFESKVKGNAVKKLIGRKSPVKKRWWEEKAEREAEQKKQVQTFEQQKQEVQKFLKIKEEQKIQSKKAEETPTIKQAPSLLRFTKRNVATKTEFGNYVKTVILKFNSISRAEYEKLKSQLSKEQQLLLQDYFVVRTLFHVKGRMRL